MVCFIHCAVAFVFLVAMVYMSFAVDKTTISQGLFNQLNELQKQKYMEIIQKRREIYLHGFAIGICLSVFAVLISRSNGQSKMGWSTLCFIGCITFLSVYFYYMLSPKPELLVVYLDKEEQRKTWAQIYRTMSFTYHFGLFLGVLGVVLFMRGLCE